MCFLFLSALDVLLEFIQGPDLENQYILVSNYFVNAAAYILNIPPIKDKTHTKMNNEDGTIIDQPENEGGEDSDDEEETQIWNKFYLELMRYRMLQILSHMLEGNDQNSPVFNQLKEFIKSGLFAKNFIWQHMLHSSQAYLDFSGLEFFKNKEILKNAIKHKGTKNNNDLKSMIAENGFNLLFIK